MAGEVVHFEIIHPNGEQLQQFYADAFGWKIDASNPMNYGMVDAGGEAGPGINGGIAAPPDGTTRLVTFYVQADDLEAALDKIEGLGGRTVMAPVEIPGGPSIAQFADPEGNVIGLVKGM